MENKYPEYIMKYVRQREGFDENDVSYDDEINKMSSNEIFDDVCNWNGLIGGYSSTLRGWIKDIYGIDLENISEQKKHFMKTQKNCSFFS